MPENPISPEKQPLSRRSFLRLSVLAASAAGVGFYQLTRFPEAGTAFAATPKPWIPNEFLPSPLETRVLGANSVLAGSQTALRVLTLDHRNGSPIKNAAVRVALMVPDPKNGAQKTQITLWKGKTNAQGTLEAGFPVPDLPNGSYELQVTADSSLGTDEFKAPLTVSDATQILLTTDKPLYQPGQTMHLRALSLARPNLEPVTGKNLIFEVEDAKGNKVFKKEIPTSKMGVAAAEFTLANEINLGRYTVRALVGEASQEKTLTVEKYVLPKFKIAVTPDKKYYLPGETLHGEVQVDYFFGKPVAGGEVAVKLAVFDVGFNQFAELKGKTGASGAFKFEAKLPANFVGLPLEQGNAFVKVETLVIDTAEHRETVSQSVPVAREAINIAVVPESGVLVPGVENTIYVFSSYPDGTPAPTKFTFQSAGIDLKGTTDQMGIGEVRLTPRQIVANSTTTSVEPMFRGRGEMRGGGFEAQNSTPMGRPLVVKVEARDDAGNSGHQSAQIARAAGEENILLRTAQAVTKAGERLEIEVFSTKTAGTAYLDVIKDKQTVLTKTIDLENGRGRLKLDLDATLAGTLQIHAYIITGKGEIARDTRLVYVNPANDLKISVTADKETYRPGAPAKLNLEVRDKNGHPVLAALGVQIVDESVFALQEMQPGMEKVYFTLEKELLEPKIEIHGVEAQSVISEDNGPRLDAGKQKVARVLFAAAQPLVNFGLNWNSFDQKQAAVLPKWQERISRDAAKISKTFQTYRAQKKPLPKPGLALSQWTAEKLLAPADVKDPLGVPYQLKPRYGEDFSNGFVLASAGMDGKFGTDDDIFYAGYIGGGVALVRGSLEKSRRRGETQFNEDTRFGGVVRGGVGNGAFDGVFADGAVMFRAGAAAAPMAQPERLIARNNVAARSKLALSEVSKDKNEAGAEPVRVRQFFPETLFVAPNLLTDERGRASVELDMADSITTWRLTSLASSGVGAMGSTTAPLRVFQDFFVDIDLPVNLTQNDEISIPVAVYNYLPENQTVHLKLETPEGEKPWFELVSDDAEKSVEMKPNSVSAVFFHLAARGIGTHKFSVTARGTSLSDAVQRVVEVLPDGKEVWQTVNDRLEGPISKTVTIPPEAIKGGSNVLVRLYPGTFSQIVDGLDKILQMPYGCFEQNASVAYPNILVMDYLKKTKQIKPELQMKAESYINAGYQRALTYEVAGGGFSWFGDAPAHKVLTAYGLLMFHDMSRVHSVDPAVIARTQTWLASKQKSDGSWDVDAGGIAEGIINRQTDVLRVSAYVLWGLAESGFVGAAIEKAVKFVAARLGGSDDPYTLALCANALAAAKKSAAMSRASQKLAEKATKEARVAFWQSSATCTGAQNKSADLETTGLAAYALLRGKTQTSVANKALTYLVQSKDPQGTWGSTQATVWSLRALLAAMETAASDANGEAIVRVNQKQAAAFVVTPKDADVMRQAELKSFLKDGANTVEIGWSGKGSALYAISSKFYLPWPGIKETAEKAPLGVEVKYDRTQLAVNDLVTCAVKVTNRQTLGATNLIVDVGIPPGFEIQTGDLAELVGSKKIAKWSLTGRTVIIYIDRLKAGENLSFDYRLKAKFPLKAKTPRSAVYEYYTPEKRGESAPVGLVVKSV